MITTRWISEISPDELPKFGGKCAGLRRLIDLEVAVPEALAVSATDRPFSEWTVDERDGLLTAADQLLARGPVAVRSSAIGEDSDEQSFAGQFETILEVSDREQLVEAIDRCLRSGASDRVIAYTGSDVPVPMGLVIQTMVDAATAGVCFTVDPAGEDHSILIEAVKGTGDALVSGRVEPECWRVYESGFGAAEAVRLTGSSANLSGAQATSIASEARRVAASIGRPQDLEWAIDRSGTLWWLQTRPITRYRPPVQWVIERSSPDADDGPVTVWSNFNVRETMPDPYRPLTWTTWRDIVIPMLVDQVAGIPRSSRAFRELNSIDLVHGYMYINLNAMIAVPPMNVLMGRLLTVLDHRSGVAIEDLRHSGTLRPRRLRLSPGRLLLTVAFASARTIPRWLQTLRPRWCMEQLRREAAAISNRRAVSELSSEQLIKEMSLWLGPECRSLRNGLQMEAMAIFVYVWARFLFARFPDAQDLLPVGIPGNPTTAISIAIDDLAEATGPLADLFLKPSEPQQLFDLLRSSPEGSAWLEKFDEILAEVGHRGPKEFDFAAPRWNEDPRMLLDLVRLRLQSGEEESTATRMQRLSADRSAAIEHAIDQSPLWKRPLMRHTARAVELYMPLREAPKHYGLFVFQRMRQIALEIGRRLANRGTLSEVEDVFHLEWTEVVALARGEEPTANLGRSIAERKDRFEQFERERPPDFLRSDGIPVLEHEPSSDDGILRGTGISSGIGRGPVTILTSPDPKTCRPGNVLVMEFADPGWTPLFRGASGIVMEVGGAMCHAAVVARELGIPAVFGARRAMSILEDGELVEVDGRRGEVRRVTPDRSSRLPGSTT